MTASLPVSGDPSSWQPYREPLRVTILRTGLIALILGAVIATARHTWALWPIVTLLVLWPSFGGHWMEIAFLNVLRPRLPDARIVQIIFRLITWFIGGVLLTVGVVLTAMMLPGVHWAFGRVWWIGGLAFIGIELIAHAVLQLRGRPSFYNGRG